MTLGISPTTPWRKRKLYGIDRGALSRENTNVRSLGPILTGVACPIQIAALGAPVSDVVAFATLAASLATEFAEARGA